jgi:hypothetical protein
MDDERERLLDAALEFLLTYRDELSHYQVLRFLACTHEDLKRVMQKLAFRREIAEVLSSEVDIDE